MRSGISPESRRLELLLIRMMGFVVISARMGCKGFSIGKII